MPILTVGNVGGGVNKDQSRPRGWLEAMLLLFGLAIGRVSTFLCVKKSKMRGFSVDAYRCTPLLAQLVPAHAHKAGSVVSLLPAILLVFKASALAQICKSVIGYVSVYVVNLLGPVAVNIEPREPMREGSFAKRAHQNSPVRLELANSSADQRFLSVPLPGEQAGFRVVVERLFETRVIHQSHNQSPLVGVRGMVLGNWHGYQLSGATLAKRGAF